MIKLSHSPYSKFKVVTMMDMNKPKDYRRWELDDRDTVGSIFSNRNEKGCFLIGLADDEKIVVAYLNDDWQLVGTGDGGIALAALWHLYIIPGEVPEPRRKVGDRVWIASVERSSEKTDCPDCLGQRTWRAISRAGFETTVECPRCHGGGKIEVLTWIGVAREFKIGSIQVRTAIDYHGGCVAYYDGDNCCGHTLQEWDVYSNEEEARAASQVRLEDYLARLPEREVKAMNLARELRLYQIKDAEIEKMQSELWDTSYRLRRMRERILELDSGGTKYVGNHLGKFGDDEGTVEVTEEQLRAVANELMWINDEDAQWLNDAREEREKECKC